MEILDIRFPWASESEEHKVSRFLRIDGDIYPLDAYGKIVRNGGINVRGQIKGNKSSDKLENLFLDMWLMQKPEYGKFDWTGWPMFIVREWSNKHYYLYSFVEIYREGLDKYAVIEKFSLIEGTFEVDKYQEAIWIQDALIDEEVGVSLIPIEVEITNEEGKQIHHFAFLHTVEVDNSEYCIDRCRMMEKWMPQGTRYFRPKIELQFEINSVPDDWDDIAIAFHYFNSHLWSKEAIQEREEWYQSHVIECC